MDVVFEDGKTLTINSDEEMQKLIAGCGNSDKDGKKWTQCFKLVYPVTYIMPDDTEITIENREDRAAIKSWYEANPDSKERLTLQYPVNIILKDGTTLTISNDEEMKRLKAGCDDYTKDDDKE